MKVKIAARIACGINFRYNWMILQSCPATFGSHSLVPRYFSEAISHLKEIHLRWLQSHCRKMHRKLWRRLYIRNGFPLLSITKSQCAVWLCIELRKGGDVWGVCQTLFETDRYIRNLDIQFRGQCKPSKLSLCCWWPCCDWHSFRLNDSCPRRVTSSTTKKMFVNCNGRLLVHYVLLSYYQRIVLKY